MPYSLRFFNVPQLFKVARRDLRLIVSYPWRLKSLTICWCNYKGSTFSSVILRPWVLVRSESNSRPPASQPDAQQLSHQCAGLSSRWRRNMASRLVIFSSIFWTDSFRNCILWPFKMLLRYWFNVSFPQWPLKMELTWFGQYWRGKQVPNQAPKMLHGTFLQTWASECS